MNIFWLQGIKKGDGTSSKDFKTTKSREQILAAFRDFAHGFPHVIVSHHTINIIHFIEYY